MSLMAFALLAAPVMQLGGVDVGSAYDVLSVKEDKTLQGETIGFIVIAALGILYSVYLAFVNIPDLKNGFAVKPTYIAIALYLAYIIIGSVMISKISDADQGVGMVTAGACPICFIVFAVIFLVVSVAILIMRQMSQTTKKA